MNEAMLNNSLIKKVLLVQPPAYTDNDRVNMNPNAPLGIAYIAAVLEKAGYIVNILDAFIEGWDNSQRVDEERLLVGMSFEEISKCIREFSPDLVGVTSMFTAQRKNAHEIAKIVKSINPCTPVIFGGAHPTAAPEEVISDKNVDFVVLGEGENTIIPLIKAIENNDSFSELDGIAYISDSGEPVVLEKTIQINDLDEIPFPARHLLPIEKYFAAGIRHGGNSKETRALSIITSRGCQYKCNFCTAFKVFTRIPRLRSAKNVIAEIQQMIDLYSIKEIWFEDDQLLAKRGRSIEMFNALADSFDLAWDTPNGISPWLLNEEIISLMKKSGCYRINMALESGVQSVLDEIINKPVKLKDVPNIINLIKKYNMDYSTFLVLGNFSNERVETLDEIKQSFQYMRKIKTVPHVSLLTAYPGSPVLDIAIDKGYLVPNFSWDDLIIQKSQLETPEWTPEQLISVVKIESLKTKLYVSLFDTEHRQALISMFLKNPLTTLSKVINFTGILFSYMIRSLLRIVISPRNNHLQTPRRSFL